MCLTLQPHGLQQARLPCPSPTPWACSNSCPLSQWCHLTISSSVVPFSCLQSCPTSGSFLMIGSLPQVEMYWSFSFSIISSSEYSGPISFRIDWFDLFVVQVTLKSLLPTPQFKSINSLALSLLYGSTLTSIHDYWKKKKKKNIALTIQTFVRK